MKRARIGLSAAWIIGITHLASGYASGARQADPPGDTTDYLGVAVYDATEAASVSHQDYRCALVNGCAPGTKLRDVNTLDYFGCTAPCGNGSCTWCAGNTAARASTCTPDPGETCMYDSLQSTPFTCGTASKMSCFFSATPPAGEPYPTPSSCYCAGPITPIVPTKNCNAINCL